MPQHGRHRKVQTAHLTGIVILVAAFLVFGVFLFALEATNTTLTDPTTRSFTMGETTFLYSWQAPPVFAVVVAIIAAAGIVTSFVGLELRDVNTARRSHDTARSKLSPWVLMNQTAGAFQGEVTITVLIPAHNEEQLVGATIDSLMTQDRLPDRVIVVADNCTDGTVAIARQRGVEVIESVDNHDRKAGALNQALATILPSLRENDTVMVMDADTEIRQGFLSAAALFFTRDRGLSAIGALFYGEERPGLLALLQRNEYIRYSREIRRRHGRVYVLTGTASIFRSTALKTVAAERGNQLPGKPGDVYDTAALTEDNELTIALKSLGALMRSPEECRVETEVMPTMKMLWRQRLRWQRGAIENLAAYGLTSTTARYWSQQLGLGYSVFALWTYFLLIFLQIVSTAVWIWYPFWILLAVVFIGEKVWTVRKGDWKSKLLAATLIPELMYDSYLDIIFVKGIFDMALRREAHWGHQLEAKKAAISA